MRFFRDLTLAGLVSVVAVVALEGGLRLAQSHYEASTYEPENERGSALRPNAEGWSTSESDVYVRINSDGMRDRERPFARPPHSLRVAVVGSSEVDARQVPLEKTFEAVMDRDLSQKIDPLGWHADVLNFGVPGYTYSQEYLTLHNHVWKYEPQIVILLFAAFPVLKTTRAFYPGELQGAPVYVLQDDGELVRGRDYKKYSPDRSPPSAMEESPVGLDEPKLFTMPAQHSVEERSGNLRATARFGKALPSQGRWRELGLRSGAAAGSRVLGDHRSVS
jgi:hypothetical protein